MRGAWRDPSHSTALACASTLATGLAPTPCLMRIWSSVSATSCPACFGQTGWQWHAWWRGCEHAVVRGPWQSYAAYARGRRAE
eukprot:14471982-Alexandrium_andersonii.AAC.1